MRNTLFSSLYNRFSPFYMTVLFLLFACLYPSNAYAAKFNIGDTVEVYNTSGVGLRLRSCASTSCSSQVTMPDGTQMTVFSGPYSADGYTWWALSGYVNGTYYAGYSAEDYLKKVSSSCSYSLSQTSQSAGSSSGTYSVSVYTSSGCSWTATSNTSWITITSGSSGSGNGTVSYSVSTNTSSSSRTGTMSIAGQTFTVTQDVPSTPPTVTTGTYQTISSSSVQLFGTVNPNGLSTTGWFEWGTTSSYGNTTNTESLGSGTSVVQMLHTISGLSSSTTYHFRAVGQNSAGTRYGEDMSFTTSAPATIKPTVTTNAATSVASSSATLKGTVNPNGAATTGWFEWGTTSSYGNTTQTFTGGSGSSDATMSWNISGLSSGTTYHYMAVAENSAGTSYGSDVSFITTSPTPTPSPTPTGTPPTVTTGTYQTISSSSVQLFGTVNPNGLSTTGWFEWGTTSSYGNTTNTQSLGSGTSVVQMLHAISGLSASTTYHFRAVGQNNAGTRYGEDMSFTTSAPATIKPIVTTNAATSVASSSATLKGTVNPNGAATTGWFEWGTTSSYGNTTQTFTGGSGSSDATMSWNISGLSSGTTYHYMAVAENSAGISYGSDVSFTTNSCSYSISPTSKSFVSSGGNESVSVTSDSGCSWTAVSNDTSWITITSGSSGSGNGTVKYSVSANTGTSSRTGTITIAGQTFTITQDKASPTPSTTPTPSACPDSYEPNDSSNKAYGPLTSGSSYSGKICSGSDVDWFKVNITTKGTISLNLTVPSSKDYDLELYDPYAWIAGSYSSNTSESISKNITTTGIYYIRISGSNGSYSTTSSYTLTFTFASASDDTTKPTGSITINSGASYTKSTTVTLNLAASDSTGVTGYYLSASSTKPSSGNTGWVSISSTTSYSADVSYALSSGDGSKSVYVWYKDTAGNVSDTASDSISLDTTAPTVTITSPTSNSTYTTTSSTISLGGSASDSTSGVSSVTWSGSSGGSGTASGTTNWSISSISLSNGDNTITVTVTDNAGNSGIDTITVKYSSGTVPTPTPTPSPYSNVSNGFDYPVGFPDGNGYYVAQDFGEYNNDYNGYHLGEDWNGNGGGNTDCGDTVYSIANGEIVFAENVGGDWENVIIIRHTLTDGSQVESMYGHLRSVIQTSGNVSGGDPIGTIGDGNGKFYCHLHFEIRTTIGLGYDDGYSSTPKPNSWTDPSDFIESHRTLSTTPTPTPTTTSIASFKVTKSHPSAFDIYIRDVKKTSDGFISAKITLINKTATWYLVTKEAKYISEESDKKISDAFLFGREEHQYDSATSASERRLESITWRNIKFTEGSSLKFSFDRNNITSYSALFIDMIGAGLLKVTLPIDALNMDDLQEFDVYNTEMETFINNLKENTWDQEFSKLIGLTWDVSKQVLKDLAKKKAKKKINLFIKAFEIAGKAVTWILDLIDLKETGTILGYMGGWTLAAPIDAEGNRLYVLIELPEDTISPLFNTEQGSQKD